MERLKAPLGNMTFLPTNAKFEHLVFSKYIRRFSFLDHLFLSSPHFQHLLIHLLIHLLLIISHFLPNRTEKQSTS